ncbi:MAG: replication initiation protein RepC [Yoonia sp.]|uniref:replication initiation protein RepC n=1 Tax=Yoonia sp. TaxID=2212373 RepID=UPI003EFA6612
MRPVRAFGKGTPASQNTPIGLAAATCDEMRTYDIDEIRHRRRLNRTAIVVRPLMGVSLAAWHDAVGAMSPEKAAVAIVAMLERFGEIQSPG